MPQADGLGKPGPSVGPTLIGPIIGHPGLSPISQQAFMVSAWRTWERGTLVQFSFHSAFGGIAN